MAQIAGAISGFDTTEIINQLMNVERQSRTKYVDKLKLHEWREDAMRDMKTDMLALKNTSNDMGDLFEYTPMAATSSDAMKVDVKTTEFSLAGTYKFENVTLATTEIWQSSSQMATGPANMVGTTGGLTLGNSWDTAGFANTPDGTITLSENNGGTVKTYSIANYATPQDLMDAVNNDFTVSLLDGGGNVALINGGVEYSISETGTNGFLSEAGITFLDLNKTFDELDAENYMDTSLTGTSFSINGATITIDPSSDTINTLVGKINQSAADVTAFFDPVEERLVLSRKTAGDNDIVIVDGDTNFKAAFQFSGSSTGGTNTTFDMNGVTMERSSNTFDINGASFTLLQGTAAGESVNVTVDKDLDTVVSDVQGWLDQYNGIMKTIKTYMTEEKVGSPASMSDLKQGMLRNDSTLRTLYQSMYELTTSSVTGLGADMNALSAIGITKDSTGALAITDETTLRNTIRNDFDAMESLFTADGVTTTEKGFGRRIEELLADYTKTNTGIMDLRIYNEGDGIDRIESQLERFDARLEKVEARYWNQFNEMEQAMAAMQSQSGSIAGLGNNWL